MTKKKETLAQILEIIALMAKRSGINAKELDRIMGRTPNTTLPGPMPAATGEKRGLEALFDKSPNTALPGPAGNGTTKNRHVCHGCGHALINRKTEDTCPKCGDPMETTPVIPGGHGGRRKKEAGHAPA